MRGTFASILFLLTALAGCQRSVTPLPQEAYVWQRQWTPALIATLDEARTTFAGYRVLAAESARDGALTIVRPDLAALAAARLPITAVLRINGGDPALGSRELAARIGEITSGWRQAGVNLRGIEIDHDCASARLPDYAVLLAALRAELPLDLRLSITALPAWIDSPALAGVLAAVDESVLQVHATRAPNAGLFDPRTAQHWIAAYAALSSKPFLVSLPAYGVRAAFDERGHAIAVEAETPRALADAGSRELRADPVEVAALLREMEHAPPANLAGVLWFRLPSMDDRRSWSFATLRAVIEAAPLRPQLAVRVDGTADGASDVVVSNAGAIDAPLGMFIGVHGRGCSSADASNGFQLQARPDGWRFATPAASVLRAGHESRVGWLRCDIVEKVNFDEAP